MPFKAFFTNSTGILVSRILGFIRDLLTATTLGAGMYSDIFFIAFKLPNLFRRLFGEGAFTQAFLPSFTIAKKKAVFCASIFLNFIIFIFLLSMIVMFFASFFTKLLAFGFDEITISKAVLYVRINFWYLSFIFVVTLLASMLQYKSHFATTAFSTALLNISMIFALILSQNKEQETIVLYLSISVVIGGFLQFLVHMLAAKKYGLLKLLIGGFKKIKDGKKGNTKGFYKGFFNGVLGAGTAQISSFIDTFFASFLAFGAISYLYYANRIFQLPLAVFAIALSTAIFPKISKQVKNNKDVSVIFEKNFHILLFMLLFSTIGGIVLSKYIIKILFEHGNFTSENTIETAKILNMYLLGLVPFGIAKLLSLWLYANMKQSIAAKITIKSLFINILCCIVLFKPLGAQGLALAGSLSGLFLLCLNIKEFGVKNFLDIIKAKKIAIISLLCLVELIILMILKEILDAHF